MNPRLPEWIRVRPPGTEAYLRTKSILENLGLNTVCQEARCPNIGECFDHSTATFMILGDICTRTCGFCHVGKGRPGAVDADEPIKLAQAVKILGMKHVVITSVDRDDLPDGGSGHFREVIHEIKRVCPEVTIEVLTPDFRGNPESLKKVVMSPIQIFNHNIETVPRLYRIARRGSIYERSLQVLRGAKEMNPNIFTKSGIMLGLGEDGVEIFSVFKDLRKMGCDILTIGQYLRPSLKELPVTRFYTPEEFAEIGEKARELGFKHVESGPLVRSSYHAWRHAESVLDTAVASA